MEAVDYYYTVGSYTCSGGKWKGEMISREHSPIDGMYPWARKEISIGFTGTYSDDGAEFDATALAGKRSFRFNQSTGCCGLKKNFAGPEAPWNGSGRHTPFTTLLLRPVALFASLNWAVSRLLLYSRLEQLHGRQEELT